MRRSEATGRSGVATVRTQDPPVPVCCPTCGDTRLVSRRQARRHGGGIGICRACSRGQVVARSTEPILRAWLEEINPAASAEAGLDLRPALGQRVRASILSVLEPFGQANEIAEIDVAFVFEVQDWRLLAHSEFSDHPDVTVMNLALTTDPRTIDPYLARGTLRSC